MDPDDYMSLGWNSSDSSSGGSLDVDPEPAHAELPSTSLLIRRRKAHLDKRQKKWADTFSGRDQMAEFVVRELLSNATDAILRQAEKGDRNDSEVEGGQVNVTVRGVGRYTVLLEVVDYGDGCEDFARSIMTEGTSANQVKRSGVTTGGKGSAKDCFSVQDGFSFVSKVSGLTRRHFAGSQDLALEHSPDCPLMNLELESNRGWEAEKIIERRQQCRCMEIMSPRSREKNDRSHGTTVVLALAYIITGTKAKVGLQSRVRSIRQTVKKIIQYTVGKNGKLDGIEFILDGNNVIPQIYLESKNSTIHNDRRFSSASYKAFNKELYIYRAEFESKADKALLVVVAETGMYQFHKEFSTNHRKTLTVVVRCQKSCKQLDSSRSKFRSQSIQDVFEELKQRMIQVGKFEDIMNPNREGSEKLSTICNGDFSSTDPLGAFLDAEFSTLGDNGTIGHGDINGTFGLAPMKKVEKKKVRKAIQEAKAQFAKRQAGILTAVPVACPENMGLVDARVVLALHTSQHVDYLMKKEDAVSSKDKILEPPDINGTSQQTRMKLYRIYCIAVNMTHNIRKAAAGIGSKVCCGHVIIQMDIQDDAEREKMHARHKPRDDKCVIGINLLRLNGRLAEIRYDYQGMDMVQKDFMSLFDAIVREVTHCVIHNSPCGCSKNDDPHCVHFFKEECKLRSHLVAKGITERRFCLPNYVKILVRCSKKLKLGTIPKMRKKVCSSKNDNIQPADRKTRSFLLEAEREAGSSDNNSNDKIEKGARNRETGSESHCKESDLEEKESDTTISN